MFWRKKERATVDPSAREELANRLALLGATPMEIARTLASLDIVGGTREFNCPVSNYLRRQYNTTDVRVHNDAVCVGSVAIPIPGVIAEFIALHDDGLFPDLQPKRRRVTEQLYARVERATSSDYVPARKDL